jgi:purine-nucleoside phosphorylase
MMKEIEKSIVRPKSIPGLSRKRVIFFPVDSSSNIIHKVIKKKSMLRKTFPFGQLYFLRNKTVLYQSIGAPAAVMCLEGLIASGAKEIILLGFCGSLNPEFLMKDVVSISKARSEEGTSRHYIPEKESFSPSDRLTEEIENQLHSNDLQFKRASIVSTDAPFRETRTWLEQKQKDYIDLVDMETSAVFALAEFKGIEAAALMIVSDEVWSGKWKKGFSKKWLEEQMKTYFLPFL